MQEVGVQSLSQNDPLEKEMANHSSILACEISWTEDPGKLQSKGLQRAGHDVATKQNQQTRIYHSSLLLDVSSLQTDSCVSKCLHQKDSAMVIAL